jgi:transcriptional repressor NrdR
LACRKRDISADRIERLVSGIQRQLETRGDEVQAAAIGEAVMAGLKTLDHVAYIRFASIYRDFSEASHFAEIVEEVGERDAPPVSDKLL